MVTSPEQSSELCAVAKGPRVCPLPAANTHVGGAQPGSRSAPAAGALQRPDQAEHLPARPSRDRFLAEGEAAEDTEGLK